MNELHLTEIWVYLSASPLMGLTMTLVAYVMALRLYEVSGRQTLLHPVLTAIALLIVFLIWSKMNYSDYFEGAQFIHFLLGPATVALAVPLYQQFSKLKKLWMPISLAILVGAFIGALSSIGMAWLLGASAETQLSLAPKSVTVPIAMGISEEIGGLPSLTAVLVILTGIIGAMLGMWLFHKLKIKDDAVKGIAMGLTAHGIGTARAFQENTQMGAFSGLAMALTAIVTALILPWLIDVLY